MPPTRARLEKIIADGKGKLLYSNKKPNRSLIRTMNRILRNKNCSITLRTKSMTWSNSEKNRWAITTPYVQVNEQLKRNEGDVGEGSSRFTKR